MLPARGTRRSPRPVERPVNAPCEAATNKPSASVLPAACDSSRFRCGRKPARKCAANGCRASAAGNSLQRRASRPFLDLTPRRQWPASGKPSRWHSGIARGIPARCHRSRTFSGLPRHRPRFVSQAPAGEAEPGCHGLRAGLAAGSSRVALGFEYAAIPSRAGADEAHRRHPACHLLQLAGAPGAPALPAPCRTRGDQAVNQASGITSDQIQRRPR